MLDQDAIDRRRGVYQQDLRLDTYSPLEREAIAYAVSKGVVVVAAVGNGTESPSLPWTFADWPAALPHARAD